MLKPAILYEEKLQKRYASEIAKDKNKFYTCSNYYNFDLEVEKDEWSEMMYVSVNANTVIGYFNAYISRRHYKVTELNIINFEEPNIIFSKDLKRFIDMLFERGFRKIEFSVVVGNPAEKLYDKFINKYGGRIVGISKESVRLTDGKLYDVKEYEILKDDYIQTIV